jgi:phage shock protein PspC (stress-responsive transcriptional regulator)
MQAADTVQTFQPADRSTPLILRNDTMLGVCTGLGEEFGFNPDYLRVAIASLFLVSFKLAIGIYLALGLALLVGRLLFPSRRPAISTPASQPAQANDAQPVPEAIAA